MNRAEFEDSLGKVYQVTPTPGECMELILQETGDLQSLPESAPEGVRRDPFFLVFRGSSDVKLPTGSLAVKKPDGSECLLGFNAEGYVENDPEKGIQYYVVVN